MRDRAFFWFPYSQVHVFVSDNLSHRDFFNVAWWGARIGQEAALEAAAHRAMRAALMGMPLAHAGFQAPAVLLQRNTAVSAVPANVPGAVQVAITSAVWPLGHRP